MPGPPMGMSTTTEERGRPGLYRLLAWLSPNFPTGTFSYSHGLEGEVAPGGGSHRQTLEHWITAVLLHGGGRIDAAVLGEAYDATSAADFAALDRASARGVAYRGTGELALESAQQVGAFL